MLGYSKAKCSRIPRREWLDKKIDKGLWLSWASIFLLALVLRCIGLYFWRAHNYHLLVAADPYIPLAKYWLGWLPNLSDVDQQRCPPGFSLLCALVFKLMGNANEIVIAGINILCSSLSCLLLSRWTYAMADRRTSLIAGIWMAVSPSLIAFSFVLQSETLFILLLLIFIIWITERWRTASLIEVFCGGVFTSVVNLTRSIFVVYAPLLFLTLIYQSLKLKQSFWKKIIIFALGWSLPLSLWTYRNWVVFHEFIPLTVQSGQALYLGLIVDPLHPARMLEPELIKMKEMGLERFIDQDRYLMRKAIEHIRANPVHQCKLTVIKFLQFWRPWPYPPYSVNTRIAMGFFYCFMFSMGVLGIWYSRADWMKLLPVYAFIASLSMAHSIFFSNFRYRLPIEPLLIFFASCGLTGLLHRFQKRDRP